MHEKFPASIYRENSATDIISVPVFRPLLFRLFWSRMPIARPPIKSFHARLRRPVSAPWVGLVKKLRAPTVKDPHEPRHIAQKIRKRKNCGLRTMVKNQWQNSEFNNAK
jgi:hypothetical protein